MNGADDMNNEQERVSAWLDGAMTQQEAAAFQQEMKGNPQLAKLAEKFQGNDARLRAAFEAPGASNISDALLGRLGRGPPTISSPLMSPAPSDKWRIMTIARIPKGAGRWLDRSRLVWSWPLQPARSG
jgi:anti-sigma factor RsiW